MKNIIIILASILAISFTSAISQTAPAAKDKEGIELLILNYQNALNKADVSKIVNLYTSNGVFMPSGAPTSIGKEQVRSAYEYVFKSIKADLVFTIDEISVSGDYAFLRSTSKGTVTINANGQTVPDENRELFVLKKEGDTWKIDRYMFNKAK